MIALSELLASALEPIFDLMPRVSPRPQGNEHLVVDGPIMGIRLSRMPVLHVPALTHTSYLPATQVPVDLGLQSLMTADGKQVTVNGTAIISICDPCRLYRVAGEDWIELAAQLVRGDLQGVVSGHNLSDSVERGRDLIYCDAGSSLFEIGIELIDIVLEDFTTSLPLRILSNA